MKYLKISLCLISLAFLVSCEQNNVVSDDEVDWATAQVQAAQAQQNEIAR